MRPITGLPMFFLLRCLFWLAVVYAVLPWDGAALRSDIAEQAEAAGKTAIGEAQALCLKDPAACAGHVASAAKWIEGVPGLSQNTLQPADLAPAWRGQSAPANVPLPPRRPG